MSLEIWDKVRTPPVDTLKKIVGGRLGGMTDIKPMWRYKAMTEVFGPCGIGWWYVVDKQWLEPADAGQIVAFVNISLFVKVDGSVSMPIPGQGGSMFTAKEKTGLHTSDEAYKMATTDALSVACKMLGVGADIYMGRWDGSKYKDESPPAPKGPDPAEAAILASFKEEMDMAASVAALETWIASKKDDISASLTGENLVACRKYYSGVMAGLKAMAAKEAA